MSTKTLHRTRSTLTLPTKTDFKTEADLLAYYFYNIDACRALLRAVQEQQDRTGVIVYFRHHLLYSPISIHPSATEDYVQDLFGYELSIVNPYL